MAAPSVTVCWYTWVILGIWPTLAGKCLISSTMMSIAMQSVFVAFITVSFFRIYRSNID